MKSKPESIESYLSQIAHELRALPASARDEELREIESHLRAMTEARGDVAEVLAQFGKPRKVGRDLRRAWERKQPEAWWRAAFALLTGLLIWSSSTYLLKGFTSFYLASHHISLESLNNTVTPQVWPTIIAMFYYQAAISYSISFIIGLALSLISPKRGIIAALPILAIPIISEMIYRFSGIYDLIPYFIFRATLSLISFAIGAYFGARLSRKRSARIAK